MSITTDDVWRINRDWSTDFGQWHVGLMEFHRPNEISTGIYVGPFWTMLDNVSAPIVASAVVLPVVLIVAFVAVRFVVRSPRSPSP